MRSAIALSFLVICSTVPAWANPPQISQGVRVMMTSGSIYDEKIKTDPTMWSFFIPRQLEVLGADATSTSEGQPFSGPDEVLRFFTKLPQSIQERGLWVTPMGTGSVTKSDSDRLSRLTNGAIQRNLPMFICKVPKEKKNRVSWLVAWECTQVSPKESLSSLICEPKNAPSPSGAPQWDCSESQPQSVPNTTLQGTPASGRP